MIRPEQALKLAKKRDTRFPLELIGETETFWLFGYVLKEETEIGVCGITVRKDNGETQFWFPPDLTEKITWRDGYGE